MRANQEACEQKLAALMQDKDKCEEINMAYCEELAEKE
jgi:hypothetical protein